ncbi:hypothetical protein [Tropicimonas sp. IMCC34011]|uniref:hypothetical protein n=1 Tax=Tropicimonas sp. IMCC34011 TaxID=2248759 RepID=UPI0018E50BE6|nr:hypothetical protein [Tropicimonas sp. IMCC34011]
MKDGMFRTCQAFIFAFLFSISAGDNRPGVEPQTDERKCEPPGPRSPLMTGAVAVGHRSFAVRPLFS